MKLGYYPGCTLKTKARNLEDAAIASMKELGIDLVELERWNCCGAVYSLAEDDLIHLLAPVRDLIRANDMGFEKVMTLCSMCYNTLARANLLMREDEVKRKTINDFLEEESDYSGEVEVVHMLGVLRDDVGWGNLKEAVKKPLDGLKLAPYYGCTLTRPREVSLDEATSPVLFKNFVEAVGGEFIDFAYAEECCGSYQILANPDAAVKTAAKIIGSAAQSGADALVMGCPLCEYNIAHKQDDVIKSDESLNPLPVYYFTQLMALALGLEKEVCKFELNPEIAVQLLTEKGLVA